MLNNASTSFGTLLLQGGIRPSNMLKRRPPCLTAFLMVHTAVGLPGSGDTAISAGRKWMCW